MCGALPSDRQTFGFVAEGRRCFYRALPFLNFLRLSIRCMFFRCALNFTILLQIMKNLWIIFCYTVYAGSRRGKTFRPASFAASVSFSCAPKGFQQLTPSTTFSYGTCRANSAAGIGFRQIRNVASAQDICMDRGKIADTLQKMQVFLKHVRIKIVIRGLSLGIRIDPVFDCFADFRQSISTETLKSR